MNRLTILITAIASVAAAACGHSSSASPSTTRSQSAPIVRAASDSAFDDCVPMFERQRTCSAEYIPALVDLRVRIDRPAGIAATDRDQGRAALVAQAHAEWAADSTVEGIAATCRQIVDGTPPDALDAQREAVATCLAAADCDDFVACIIPVTEAAMSRR